MRVQFALCFLLAIVVNGCSAQCSSGLLGSTISLFPAQTIDFWIKSDNLLGDNGTLEFFFAWDQDRLTDFATGLVRARETIANITVRPLACPETPWVTDLRQFWVNNVTVSFNVPQSFAGHLVIAKAGHHVWPFTVLHSEPAKPQDIVVLWNSLTYTAYNPWGGSSVYSATSSNKRFSLYRPLGSANVLGWQMLQNIPAISWLKRNGLTIDNVHVATDLDLAFNCSAFAQASVWVISGHPEYWTLSEKRCFESWLDGGGRLIYMAANGFWERVEVDNNTRSVMEAKVDVHSIEGFEGQVGRKWNDMPGERRGAEITGAYFDYSTYCIGGEYRVLLSSHWALKTAGVKKGLGFAGEAVPKVPYSGACGTEALKYHSTGGESMMDTPWGALNWESDVETDDSPERMDRIAYGTNTADKNSRNGSPMLYVKHKKSCVFSTNSITSPWALQNDAVFSAIMGEVLERFRTECPPLETRADNGALGFVLLAIGVLFCVVSLFFLCKN